MPLLSAASAILHSRVEGNDLLLSLDGAPVDRCIINKGLRAAKTRVVVLFLGSVPSDDL